jgi:hypothetical protein
MDDTHTRRYFLRADSVFLCRALKYLAARSSRRSKSFEAVRDFPRMVRPDAERPDALLGGMASSERWGAYS